MTEKHGEAKPARRRVVVDLDALKLDRGPHLVEMKPVEFTDASRDVLAAWLDEGQIESLRQETENGAYMWRLRSEGPTIGEQRAVLAAIAELAGTLEEVICSAPAMASAALMSISKRCFDNYGASNRLAAEARALADGCRGWLASHPEQGRRNSPTIVIGAIAPVLAVAGIRLSDAEGAPFFKIAREVFQAAGIFQSPAGAIRAFMQLRDNSPPEIKLQM